MKEEFQVGSALDIGNKRSGKPNQDSIGIFLPKLLNRRPPLLVLSDGMADMAGEKLPAGLTVKSILRSIL